MVKKLIVSVAFICLFISYAYSSEWFDKNMELSVVFNANVWTHIENANKADNSGKLKEADQWLSKAEQKIEETRPFITESWPSNWPYNVKALAYLKYATPDAYLYRIIGDYAYSHKKAKEALNYYNKYITHSIIPDTTYMNKTAEVYETEGLLKDAKIMYANIQRVIDSKNFHGTSFSAQYLAKKIKNLDAQMKQMVILPLDVFYTNVPDFLKSDFQNIFINELSNMDNFSVISKSNVEKILTEKKLNDSDLQDVEELSAIGKTLNINYILRPSLAKAGTFYIFLVDVFDPQKKVWFDSYEYKTESPIYLPNLIQRFTSGFQGELISDSLLLPEVEFVWEYEVDSPATDSKLSENGKRIIVGGEQGDVYILTAKGTVLKQFKSPDKVLKVAISPCGDYFAWGSLNGLVYFADIKGIRWTEKTGNDIRAIDISNGGKFMVFGVNDEILFKDIKGETFWRERLPQWITKIAITNDSHRVFAGMENGEYWCFSDEGNLLWEKNFYNRIADIKSTQNYNGVITEKGETFILDNNGDAIFDFEAGKGVQYAASTPEIIKIMSGKNGNYLYFLSRDKNQLWEYSIREKVNFIEALADGTLITSIEGKNISAFRITWK